MKKPKLFTAYNGDAAGLRNCLIEHFKTRADGERLKGEDYEAGITVGERWAYGEVVRFLKNLVINADEYPEANNAAGQ